MTSLLTRPKHLRSPPAWGELASMLGMVRGLVVGLVDSGSLLHWDRARMLAKRFVGKKHHQVKDGVCRLTRNARSSGGGQALLRDHLTQWHRARFPSRPFSPAQEPGAKAG